MTNVLLIMPASRRDVARTVHRRQAGNHQD
jgi:hypothetical protein